MEKTKKITRATIKSFVKKNFNNLYIKNLTEFDGMQDMTVANKNAEFRKAVPTQRDFNYTLGVDGAYVLPNRNLFDPFENENYVGYNVWNCCGEFVIAIKK